MKKWNLKLFKVQVERGNSKSCNIVIQFKEENNLVSFFLVTSRKKSELKLECCIGGHKFSFVLKYLFTEVAVPLICKDKSTIMNIIKNLENPEVQILGNAPANSTLIIYFMAKIVKGKSMKTLHIPMFFVLFYYPKSDSQ